MVQRRRALVGDPLCKACRGTGRDLGDDNPMRDGNPVLACAVCGGSGEGRNELTTS